MRFIQTVFRNELRQLLRQRWLVASLISFFIAALLSIFIGNKTVKTRMIQIDSLQQSYQRDLQGVLRKYADTADAKGKAAAKSAGMAVMINFWLPQNTIKETAPLASLSLGLMDIQPWQQQVKYTKSYNEVADMPVTNPMTLFTGNFDLSFVIIYLLPLLVVAYCYSVYASENENGTLPLLKVQAGGIHRLIRTKLLFRLLVLGSPLMLVNLMGFIFSSKNESPSLTMMLLWSAVTLLYLAFWMAVAYLIVSFRKNTIVSGLYMVSCWVVLLVLLPSVVNSYIQSKHPLPMRDEVASYRRHQGEEIWGTRASILSDSFNRYNPQYASSIDLRKDTLHLSTRYVAGYYDLLERRMERKLEPFRRKIEQRNEHFDKLSRWNPALLSQHLLNNLAGTDLGHYKQFFAQQDTFQQAWKDFLYEFHIPDKRLTPDDIKKLPAFSWEAPAIRISDIMKQTAYVILLMLTMAAVAFWSFRNN
jgi:ABC-2 type transport system permease protein